MRKLTATLFLISLANLFLLAQSPNDKDLLEKAKALYKKKDYVGSVQTLERIEPRTAEAIYWFWKNEGEIGWRASIGEQLGETDRRYKYYLYVKDHPEYFNRGNPPYTDFHPTRKRLDEIKTSFPCSKFIGFITFERLHKDLQLFYWESSLNEEGRIAMISYYQQFLNEYPEHHYTQEAQKQVTLLEKFENLHSYFPAFYRRGFHVSEENYRQYISKWLKSGPHRAHTIEVIPSQKTLEETLPGLDIPEHARKQIRKLVRNGKLIVISAAAFHDKQWSGEKFLVFDRKAN